VNYICIIKQQSMALNASSAAEFNRSLKAALASRLGHKKFKVRIVNSYNFPNCWVQVWLSDDAGNGVPSASFPNDLRLEIFDAMGGKREDLLPKGGVGEKNVVYGNIRMASISAYVKVWSKIFEKA
jgi:hypothetical protein